MDTSRLNWAAFSALPHDHTRAEAFLMALYRAGVVDAKDMLIGNRTEAVKAAFGVVMSGGDAKELFAFLAGHGLMTLVGKRTKLTPTRQLRTRIQQQRADEAPAADSNAGSDADGNTSSEPAPETASTDVVAHRQPSQALVATTVEPKPADRMRDLLLHQAAVNAAARDLLNGGGEFAIDVARLILSAEAEVLGEE